MNDISDGELKFTNRRELQTWLEKQPREVSVVIAAWAALGVTRSWICPRRRHRENLAC